MVTPLLFILTQRAGLPGHQLPLENLERECAASRSSTLYPPPCLPTLYPSLYLVPLCLYPTLVPVPCSPSLFPVLVPCPCTRSLYPVPCPQSLFSTLVPCLVTNLLSP